MGIRKFGLNYELFVQAVDGTTIIIKPPFTLDFNITRKTLADANVGSFKIYNLSERVRNLLRKDQDDVGNLKQIVVKAGYGKQLADVFKGNVSKGWSVREGVNFLTQMECYDGGFALVNTTMDQTFPKGTLQRSILKAGLNALKAGSVEVGAIGNFTGAITKGNSFSGAAAKVISELSGGAFFVDNGKSYILKDDEVIDTPPKIIDSSSGLIGTPTREFQFINLEMVFEPQISVGQRIILKSLTGDNLNGLYKVHSIQHAGIISGSVSSSVKTDLGLQPGSFTIVAQESS